MIKNILLPLVMLLALKVGGQSIDRTTAKADSLFLAGDFKTAHDLYAKVMTNSTINATAWSRFGYTSFTLKKFDDAKNQLEKALAQIPPNAVRVNTFATLARLHALQNNKVQSLACLDSAASLGYLNLKLIDSNDDLKSIRSEKNFKAIRDRIYNNQNPCMTNSKAREFDFWIGDWDVYVTGTKQYAGHNKIELVSGGCALLENWESNASSGKSLNFFNAQTGKWRQTWVGSYTYGIQDFVDGEYKDGAMRFKFEGVNAQGQKYIGRFYFYNEKPGQVRQFNETSIDEGKTWVTSYDFTYIRKN